MIRNYIKVAWRNLLNKKVYSFINIIGLAIGLAVTILIGLWIWDELSFDKYHTNHKTIAQVFIRNTVNGEAGVQSSIPIPLADELRTSFGSEFKHVVLSSGLGQYNLSFGDRKFSKLGCFMEADAPEMLSLKMIKGSSNGLNDPSSVLLSQSLAKTLLGDEEPIGQVIKISNRLNLKVIGVYEDFPANSSFRFATFIGPWDLYTAEWDWVKGSKSNWNNNSFSLLVQISANTTFERVNNVIKDVVSKNVEIPKNVKVEAFLHPMDRWHLYSKFENGMSVDGQIQYVWLVGIIGFFVLILACINFMNLSTARSEKRAKEVGIRKAVGSARGQLIIQFFSESILTTFIAFAISLLLVQLILPWFNNIAYKEIAILWGSPVFWLTGIVFSIFTGLIAGSYPALYLSSFKPIKVLKGSLRIGKSATLPRSFLVVLQFIVSILLVIGTVVVFKQIQYAKDRPVGYNREGLISIQMTTPEIYENYQTIQTELLRSGAVMSVSESQGPLTDTWSNQSGFDWKGKDPSLKSSFAIVGVTHGYGKTVGWEIKEGRDFLEDLSTDSSSLILNESAIEFMGLKDPIGEFIKWNDKDYKIVGVVKNIIMNSPYDPVRNSVFYILPERGNFVNIRIDPNKNVKEALEVIQSVFQQFNPSAPFDFVFADDAFAQKFTNEERIGKLASFFSILAIVISCLGLFGMASFIAEQKTKEIGIRKILGASIVSIWNLLSKEFVVLVIIAFLVAVPLAYLLMTKWLRNYEYHTDITWWVFALTGLSALLIALLTVSFQAVKVATANPVDSLRDE